MGVLGFCNRFLRLQILPKYKIRYSYYMHRQGKVVVVMWWSVIHRAVWLCELSPWLVWKLQPWIAKLGLLKLSLLVLGFFFLFLLCLFILKQVTSLSGYLKYCHKALPTLVFLPGLAWLYDADRRLHYCSGQGSEHRHAGGEYGNAQHPYPPRARAC